ncbi:MAG: bifunctional 5,10-methylenetetrahydrofolate dehydrogenase/5,10-methenyltetrahydrofolate cyclohydrolase [Candidatus Nomurabacteria bacterium]|nr:MAG: bifunctional 5,10-methylenetetrahydrofolate dehydrogenase/5,10-methenyltetrahydrofolate cyclohydrolase [Candidatus Nomurabacteria bacterium]HRV75867.1 bifunctional 5,10-methylenetetrahydrofolate dehydrogenase/5,10-methenyltetrahydrofolate cyclohydrolase [Candidatus Saccharimonadales bacterium]
MKFLKGSELVEYISERQAKQIRGLVQSKSIQPKLAIINTNPNHKPSQKYLELKKARGEELGITVDIHQIVESVAEEKIKELAKNKSVHGIILQLPLEDPTLTDELTNLIPPEKDVDGLNKNSLVEPATVGAILWLLAGYNIDLKDKDILIIGQGKLVGLPLLKTLKDQNLSVKTLDETNSPEELKEFIQNSDIIITATGSPGLIKSEMIKDNQVIIDAGTSEDGGVLKGDLDPEVYNSKLDIKITPSIGGVGPLTISYLYENLLHLIDKNS